MWKAREAFKSFTAHACCLHTVGFPTIHGLASHFAPFADLRLKSHLMGFRQAAHECATLACGLFPREDNQGPTDSRIAFLPPFTAQKNLDNGPI